jgi:hypothetical protein
MKARAFAEPSARKLATAGASCRQSFSTRTAIGALTLVVVGSQTSERELDANTRYRRGADDRVA